MAESRETEGRAGLGATVRIEGAGRPTCLLELDSVLLRVIEGPDAGKRASLQLSTIRVGSAPDNDLVLADGTVSRHHAEVTLSDAGITVRDLGSTNGTWVGTVKVTEVQIEPGSEVAFGSSRVAVERHLEERVVAVGEEGRFGALIGSSRAMRDLYAILGAVAPTQATVLIRGESGTGKELVARTLHERSGRPGPLVVFDAATTDPEMVRNDLFGHVKGAFTGAAGDRQGAFRAADTGTLFIDEIGELPLDLQPRLLRALENREVTPVGADLAHKVDVRVVAATHRDLPAMVREGTFREDLFHRLSIVPVDVPPLRERAEDIPLLVDHLVASIGIPLALTDAARAALARYPWPGNVRELRNTLERAAALSGGRPVDVAGLRLPEDSPYPTAPLEEIEKDTILEALERNGGNKAKTARDLGMSLSTLKRRLATYQDA